MSVESESISLWEMGVRVNIGIKAGVLRHELTKELLQNGENMKTGQIVNTVVSIVYAT